MAEISFERIKTIFLRIAGESETDDYDDLIARAEAKIISLLSDDDPDEDTVSRCEYAAAAEAAYEHACELCASEQLVMSESGAVRRGSPQSSTVAAAARLRDHAFAELADVVGDRGFVFNTVGG